MTMLATRTSIVSDMSGPRGSHSCGNACLDTVEHDRADLPAIFTPSPAKGAPPKEHGVARAAGMARHPGERQTAYGQMYLAPSGGLKQPIDSGNSVFGNQSTALGKKIAKAIVMKKIT
jgi:hypothetical protein